MMQNSQKRWKPDPSLPPEEQAKAVEPTGILAAIKERYKDYRKVREVRRIISDKRRTTRTNVG